MISAADAVLPMPISPIAIASAPAAIARAIRSCRSARRRGLPFRRSARLARRIARAVPDFGGDQMRMRRQVGCDARVDHPDLDAGRGRERIDARPSGEERRDHRGGDARRIARDAFFGQPVIAREDEQHDALDLRREIMADQPELHREILDAAERARRLRLAVDVGAQRRLERAVDGLDRQAFHRVILRRPHHSILLSGGERTAIRSNQC